MSDLRSTIIPKSDQLNADDLIGRTMTIKVSGVKLLAGEQPVAIDFEGDGGKPYKPGKSMRRVLVQVWGHDGNAYIGRRMTLYRDEAVKFGGQDVGGIRISHMSHIDAPVTMALTETRAKRKPFTVRPLADDAGKKRTVAELLADTRPELEAAGSAAEIDAIEQREDVGKVLAMKGTGADQLRAMFAEARARVAPAKETPDWPGPTPEEVRAQREAEAGQQP